MNYSFEIRDIILFKKVVSLKSVSSCTLLDKSVIILVQMFSYWKDFLLSVNNVLKEDIKPVWENLQIKVSIFILWKIFLLQLFTRVVFL